jgi:protein N-terminal amidase
MAEIIAPTLGQTRVRQRRARASGELPAVARRASARACVEWRRDWPPPVPENSVGGAAAVVPHTRVEKKQVQILSRQAQHVVQQRATRLPEGGSGGCQRVAAAEMVRLKLKVACLQLNPAHGDPASSMRTADEHLARLTRDDGVHILLLPEMAFSGYCFDDVADVSRVAETDDGPTVRWCAKHAARLGCTVLCGYPRRVPGAKIRHDEKNGAADADADALYNALVAVGPDGTTLTHYHKSFLYVVDKTWADEGSGFVCVDIPVRKGKDDATAYVRATLGVCMDINPREFEAPWEAYELATAAKAHGSSLVLFASAWTNNHPDDDPATVTPVDPREVMSYWLNRLAPLVGAEKNTHFVCANRVGEERGITFTGCSCVMSLREPSLVEAFGATQEGLLIATIDAEEWGGGGGDRGDKESLAAADRL